MGDEVLGVLGMPTLYRREGLLICALLGGFRERPTLRQTAARRIVASDEEGAICQNKTAGAVLFDAHQTPLDR